MDSRFESHRRFVAAQFRRGLMRAAIRPLVSWKRLREPDEGYTIVIAGMHRLVEVALANISFVGRMDLRGVRELLLVLDCTEEQIPPRLRERARALCPGVGVRVIPYTPRQRAVARAIQWGWVYAWLSWCIGVSQARTRYVLLHDLDAMPLNPALFRRHHEAIRTSGQRFIGWNWYEGCGLEQSDRLVTTFEMMFDAQHVRERFRPIDVFNKVTSIRTGCARRRIEFDTFLYVQHRTASADVCRGRPSDMVHPSQLICQYTDHIAGRGIRGVSNTNLPMLPYYFYLGGNPAPFLEACEGLRSGRRFMLFGRPVSLASTGAVHRRWLCDQIVLLESVVFGMVRPQVEEYLDLLEDAAIAQGGERRPEVLQVQPVRAA